MSTLKRNVMRQEKVVTESPFTRTLPFDYVVTVPFGQSGVTTQSLVNISTVGPFVVTGIGYSLLTNERVAPKRFGSKQEDPVDALRNTPTPQLAPPAPPPIIVKSAPKARRRKSAPAAVSTTPSGFRLFGAPDAVLSVIVNGQPLKAGTVQLDSSGRAEIDLSDLQGQSTVILTDITNGRSSQGLVLVRVDNDSGSNFSVTPQFGPTEPHIGSERFDVVVRPGAELEASVLAADGRKIKLRQNVTVPSSDDKSSGIVAGRVQVELSKAAASSKKRTLAPGDLLIVRDTASNLSTRFQVAINPLDFSLRALPAFALRNGFRLDRVVLEKYLDNEILPPPEEAFAPFVPCGSDPGELSFLYSIIDNGTGRALQSEPIHNIAGLGIADGDRPFRTFPKPFVLNPRSVLLFQVQALSGGPGTLYFVLQGYKVVGGSRMRLPGSH